MQNKENMDNWNQKINEKSAKDKYKRVVIRETELNRQNNMNKFKYELDQKMHHA